MSQYAAADKAKPFTISRANWVARGRRPLPDSTSVVPGIADFGRIFRPKLMQELRQPVYSERQDSAYQRNWSNGVRKATRDIS